MTDLRFDDTKTFEENCDAFLATLEAIRVVSSLSGHSNPEVFSELSRRRLHFSITGLFPVLSRNLLWNVAGPSRLCCAG